MKAKRIGLWLGPLVAACVWAAGLDPAHPAAGRTAAVAAWMAVWWLTECVPLAVTALLPMALFPLAGVMDGKAVAREYFNHVVFLFLGGFLVALALERWNLHRRIALALLLRCGVSPRRLVFGFLLAGAFLSMWISNTAAAMMLTAIALAVIGRIAPEGSGRDRLARTILLAVTYGCSIGGMATLVGTPPNLSFVRIFERMFPEGPPITFAEWLGLGLPLASALLLAAWGVLLVVSLRDDTAPTAALDVLRRERNELGPLGVEERRVALVFGMLVLGWVFRRDLDLGFVTLPGWSRLLGHPAWANDGVTATAAGVLLFVLPARGGGHLLEEDAIRKIPWGVVLLFGGGFALAAAFQESGLSRYLGERAAAALPESAGLRVGGIALCVSFLTELTSNTATTEMLLPVAAGLGQAAGTDPRLFMLPVTLAASLAFMMPVATPPNAIVFASGRLSVRHMAATGVVLNLIAVLSVAAAVLFLGPVSLGLERGGAPSWAR